MTHISLEVGRNLTNAIPSNRVAGWTHPAGLTNARNLPWRRITKFALGAALLAVGGLTTYQQVVVRVSREAVINARVASVRAPMDGIVKTATTAPGRAVQAGAPIGNVEDPMADDARVFQLQQDAQATERERHALSRRVADLQQARRDAEAQAEAFRLGRVRQDELRVEEARAGLSAAMARETDASAAESRGAALHARGYMADAAPSAPSTPARSPSRTRSPPASGSRRSPWSSRPPEKAPISATTTTMSPPRFSGRAN
jgi:hypothetical protein